MATINKYQFTPLEESNSEWLITLYKRVFNISYNIDQIKAKFFSSYSGIRAQGHFALFEGKPIAFHGAVPVLMNYKGEIELSAQYGDAMTLPQFAGQGLFTSLGELTDTVLQNLGVKFVWGFPNQNSEYGYVNKLNWSGESRMKCFIIPVKTIPKEAILRKTKVLEKGNQKLIKSKLQDLLCDEPLQSIDSNRNPTTNRSKTYFEYKCFSPNYVIKVDDTKVWIKPLGGLLVGDLEVNSKDKTLKTVEKLTTIAKKLGLSKVVIQTSPNSSLFEHLEGNYPYFDSWLIGYKNFSSNFPLDKLAFTYGDLDTF